MLFLFLCMSSTSPRCRQISVAAAEEDFKTTFSRAPTLPDIRTIQEPRSTEVVLYIQISAKYDLQEKAKYVCMMFIVLFITNMLALPSFWSHLKPFDSFVCEDVFVISPSQEAKQMLALAESMIATVVESNQLNLKEREVMMMKAGAAALNLKLGKDVEEQGFRSKRPNIWGNHHGS